jgi:hypothetical protein
VNQFATESAREVYGDDHWLDILLPTNRYDPHDEAPAWWSNFTIPVIWHDNQAQNVADFAVITDLRADNEMQRVTELGGINVKIKRRDAERAERTYYEKKGIDRHLFATELPDKEFDVVLVNDDNNLDNAYVRTDLLMHEINYNGIASIKRGVPLPWVI